MKLLPIRKRANILLMNTRMERVTTPIEVAEVVVASEVVTVEEKEVV